jgi:hypothetical protein
MKYLFFGLFVAVIGLCTELSAKVVMVPQLSSVGLLPKQSVWNVLVTNAGQDAVTASLRVTARERASGVIYFNAFSGGINIVPGANLLNENAVGLITVEEIHYLVSSTGFFPAGYYDFCFELEFFDGKTDPIKECIAVDVEAMSPPFLILPEDSSSLPNQYPVFIWMPPAPIVIFPQLLYDFILVEQYPGQPGNEAIQRNNPVVAAFNLTSPVFPLAGTGTQLDTGKTYIWQIIARNGDTYGSKSEAWSFTIADLDTTAGEWSDGNYYVQLSGAGTPPSYSYSEELAFTLYNEANDKEGIGRLYSIGNGGRHELKTQTFKLTGGRNYIKWAPKLNHSGQAVYLLRVELPSGKQFACYLLQNAL